MTKDNVKDAFERALEEILARVFACEGEKAQAVLAVAYSGGLDSSVLLHLARTFAGARGLALHAFHVHHGLSPNADAWARHCEDECERLGIPFVWRTVQVRPGGEGIEQAARKARYAALGQLCAEYQVDLLLTAHHQDDQVETVLLQLLRGAGVAGLAGMETLNAAPGLLGQERTRIARPLLEVSRSALCEWAVACALVWVEDESNADSRYRRNRLRHGVMPLLARDFPGFEARIARAAGHLRDAKQLLDELAREDLRRHVAADGSVAVDALRELGRARGDNLLRHWFATRGVRMPSAAWLEQLRAQVLQAGEDARVRVTHPDCEVWRYRGRLMLVARIDDSRLDADPVRFRWNGEGRLEFEAYLGCLHFESAATGLDPAWLREQVLTLRRRQGGERLRPGAGRPSRDLKHHFQALGVPPWERRRLPLLEAGSELLYVAGIGMHHGRAAKWIDNGIIVRWEASSS